MILKKFLIKVVKSYQYLISPLLGNNCRYYPTCSEYAIWEFENDNLIKATFKIIIRILKCNQFFKGGIDYPIIKKNIINPLYGRKRKIQYWLIPIDKNRYYLIKANHE